MREWIGSLQILQGMLLPRLSLQVVEREEEA